MNIIMKKFIKIMLFAVLLIFILVLLSMSGAMVGWFYYDIFCNLFDAESICNLSSNSYDLSKGEIFFWILWTSSLGLIIITIFYYDNKKLLKKITQWKKIKSFRFMW